MQLKFTTQSLLLEFIDGFFDYNKIYCPCQWCKSIFKEKIGPTENFNAWWENRELCPTFAYLEALVSQTKLSMPIAAYICIRCNQFIKCSLGHFWLRISLIVKSKQQPFVVGQNTYLLLLLIPYKLYFRTRKRNIKSIAMKICLNCYCDNFK